MGAGGPVWTKAGCPRPRRQVSGGGGLGVEEDGLHGVLAQGVYAPADAFDFVRWGLHDDGAESCGVMSTVVGLGAEDLQVLPGEGTGVGESAIRVAEAPGALQACISRRGYEACVGECGVLDGEEGEGGHVGDRLPIVLRGVGNGGWEAREEPEGPAMARKELKVST